VANFGILKQIQKQLGFGQCISKGARVHKFLIQRREELELIVLLFNGNIILPSRKSQFSNFVKAFTDNNKPRYYLSENFTYLNRKLIPSLNNL